jgi:acetolactate synthase I/II/III large subunit
MTHATSPSVDQNSLDREEPANTGAEALIQLAVAHGVDQIFLNPGTDTAPIQEAVVAMRARGQQVPRLQLCPDERVAMAAAQAYWQLTGKVQLVVVHVDVGTLALGAAIHNAQRTNGGVVVIAGTAPRTFDGELAGGRSIAVHWQQDQIDQLGIMRNFTKWSQEITMLETMPTLVPRAFQIAASAPAGPVYLTVAREVLMRPATTVRVISPKRRPTPERPAAPPEAIEQAASWLVDAQHPVLVTSRLGRDPDAVAVLSQLAQRIGMPVLDAREYLNLPSSHPCYIESDDAVGARLGEADLVLLVDVEVPWVPERRRPPETARVVQIDLDPIKASIANWSYAVDLSIQACPTRALNQLADAVEELAGDEFRQRGESRLQDLTRAKDARSESRRQAVADAQSMRPVSPLTLLEALDDVIAADTLVLEEVTTNDMVVREHLGRELPGSILAIGAAGLGWAPGAAFGAKLADPEREVVALVGDGTFIFSAPLAWMWAAHDAGVAFLTVVFNNAGYRAAKLPVVGLFPPRVVYVPERLHRNRDVESSPVRCDRRGVRRTRRVRRRTRRSCRSLRSRGRGGAIGSMCGRRRPPRRHLRTPERSVRRVTRCSCESLD